jgi:hypothetical protein
VPDDEQPRQSRLTRLLRRVVNEGAADATAHRLRLDEEVVEFSIVPGGSPGRESKKLACAIDCNTGAAGGDRSGVTPKI